jgi:DNA-binding transcriptional LysR family regulator
VAHVDITSLRLFASVVEHENIAKAARVNNIAASAISKRISDLEMRLDVSLLYRMKEGVKPTPAGRALFGHAKRVLSVLENMNADMSEYRQGLRGQVRLWANTSAVTQFLPEDLVNYLELHPDVKIELREETSEAIVEAVREGAADLGIFSEHFADTGISTRVYRRDTLMVIVPKKHPLAGRTSIRFEETSNFDHVGLQEGSSLQGKLLEEAARQDLNLRIRVKVLGFDGIRRMVEAGLGLAVLPEGAVTPYSSTGMFATIPLDEPWAKRSLLLGFRELRSLPIVARTLMECLAPAET